MASYQLKYELVRPPQAQSRREIAQPDRMAVVTALNRIATVACQRIILMLNNTEMIKQRRLSSMNEVLLYLNGQHEDLDCAGDKGDFYRRKLAEQIYLNFAIEGIDHTNVMPVVEAAIILERETRRVLGDCAFSREWAPPVQIDETILDILSRMADVH